MLCKNGSQVYQKPRSFLFQTMLFHEWLRLFPYWNLYKCDLYGKLNKFTHYRITSAVPFFDLVFLLCPLSLSSFSSRSFQRRTCSSLILRKRILFCSSLRASRTSGSTHISWRIWASILPLFPGTTHDCQPLCLSVHWVVFQQWGVIASFPAVLRVGLPFSLKDMGSGTVLAVGGQSGVVCQVLFLWTAAGVCRLFLEAEVQGRVSGSTGQ